MLSLLRSLQCTYAHSLKNNSKGAQTYLWEHLHPPRTIKHTYNNQYHVFILLKHAVGLHSYHLLTDVCVISFMTTIVVTWPALGCWTTCASLHKVPRCSCYATELAKLWMVWYMGSMKAMRVVCESLVTFDNVFIV